MSGRYLALLLLLGLVVTWDPTPAAAQLTVPTAGSPGVSGASSSSYNAAVPLELPPSRGGLPIPVHIVYSERGIGAAGRGWDVPLSYIRRETTLARRRPIGTPNVAPQIREQATLALDGRQVSLVRTADGWSARYDAPELQVRESGDGTWVVYDGHGRAYRFGVVSAALSGTGLWLLQDITDLLGARVHLDYSVTVGSLRSTPVVSIDLIGVSYNPHPSTEGCYKHTVGLDYDTPLDPPLAISSIGAATVVRRHKLAAVRVSARADCTASPVRLRTYQLDYLPDDDTRQPRLQSVSLLGQEGSPEASTPIVVARYGYGSATAGGMFHFDFVSHLGTSAPEFFGNTGSGAPARPNLGNGYSVNRFFVDVTGDGRPDVVSINPGGPLMYQRNQSSAGQFSFATEARLSGGELIARPMSAHTAQAKFDLVTHIAYSRVWRQAIDMNGDGRVDLVDASEQPGHWIIYLNTPDPADSAAVTWVRMAISTAGLSQALAARGFASDGGFLPLARQATGWNGLGTSGVDPGLTATVTEWELRDINGDGYPDVVFNAAPAIVREFPVIAPGTTNAPGGGGNPRVFFSVLPNGGPLQAVLNVLGAHLRLADDEAFSAPVTLAAENACGLEKWVQDSPDTEHMECGLIDVNGDGLADRVAGTEVQLGQGTLSGGYFTSSAVMSLPGRIIHGSTASTDCKQGNIFFRSEQTSLLDVTGDGVPDYLTYDSELVDTLVAIGTGAGFTAPVLIERNSARLPFTRASCDGSFATIASGWLDLDGDGRRDFFDGDAYFLVGSDGRGAPSAGRLTRVDNGFGAQTRIRYRSIKGDPGAAHQVPYAEVVVDSVETVGTKALGGSLSATRYAYGGAELVFDPARDSFVFPGYRRTVMLQAPVSQPAGLGTVMITDTYGPVSAVDPYGLLAGANPGPEDRYALFRRLGKTRDVTVLSGDFGADALTNPQRLLGVDVTTDNRRIGAAHYEWTSRRLTSSADPPGPEACTEAVFPYSYANSSSFAASHSHYDPCVARGFTMLQSVQTWRGAPGAAPPATANVETRTEVTRIDDLGRVLASKNYNDLNRDDDDVCTDVTYAEPVRTLQRVLTAVYQRTTSDCNGVTLAGDSWGYDAQQPGLVSAGNPSWHRLERRSDTGQLLSSDVVVSIIYDGQGNAVWTGRMREDQAIRNSTMSYDPFGLALTSITTTGTNVPTLQVSIDRDPVTLLEIGTTDPNGTRRGSTFDGFGRPVLSTVTPPGGAPGALSITSYLGYTGNDTTGRRVVYTTFPDPVDPTTASSAVGSTMTTFLDELGRARRSELALGADYAGLTLVSQRTYDGLGRVVFEADPFPSDQRFDTAYGTTRFFNADGTPACTVRANGQLTAMPSATDEAREVYPTCFDQRFEDHTVISGVRDAASLLAGSPQSNVVQASYTTATGRVLSRSTYQGTDRIEHATFGYDRLGRMTAITRYQDPAQATQGVTSSWHFDSLGQMVELDERDSSPRFYTYDAWGELTDVSRFPDGSIPSNKADISTGLHSITRYDALGRVIHREERRDGEVDFETYRNYFYDDGVAIAPQVTPTYTLGRLTQAATWGRAVSFSYDALGRVNARVFTDGAGGTYVEGRTYRGDGALTALDLYLPDTGFAGEHVAYDYDSAGRGSSVTYSMGGPAKQLYTASRIDALGRVRQARYGTVGYQAIYADVGRRLLSRVAVAGHSITYTDYDPLGRERSRTEVRSASAGLPAASSTTSHVYDALGRLSGSIKTGDGAFNQQFAYDPLGNLTSQWDPAGVPGVPNITMQYLESDRDRICRIALGQDNGMGCNVTYDDVGAITSQPTPNGTRRYSYRADGMVRTIDDEQASAHLRYDAFGELQELQVTSGGAPRILSTDHLIRYGELLELRIAADGSSRLRRQIPLPNGGVATLLGTGGLWAFALGEQRGARFSFDELGVLKLDTDYTPYGSPSFAGIFGRGLANNEQWNEGYFLAEFGLTRLGARLYDPMLGRFLSRDPLLVPQTATTSNPYAFADGDPINRSDPTGMRPSMGPGRCPINDALCDSQEHEGSSGPTGPRIEDIFIIPTDPDWVGPVEPDPIGAPGGGWGRGAGTGGQRYPSHSQASATVLGGGALLWALPDVLGAGAQALGIALLPVAAAGAGAYWSYKTGDNSIVCAEDPTICVELELLADKLEAQAAEARRAAAIARADATAEPWGKKERRGRTLYHYTNETGFVGILESEKLWPSKRGSRPKSSWSGNGQYLTDIIPGTKTPWELSRALAMTPWLASRFTHYVEIDVTGLNVRMTDAKRPWEFLIPSNLPLDLTGRIVSWGQVP